MDEIICSVRLFRELLLIIQRGQQATVRAGLHETSDGVRWLLRSPFEIETTGDVAVGPAGAEPGRSIDHEVRLFVAGVGALPGRMIPWLAPPITGLIVLGDGEHRGLIWAAVLRGDEGHTIERVRLIGEGMHELIPVGASEELALREPRDPEKWSRTIGALGGLDAWHRLSRLSIALIGCGRSGSLMAQALTGLGVERLLLVDGDRVERTNLGEMTLVRDSDIGRHKAVALREHLSHGASHCALDAIVVPIVQDAALRMAATADVLVCCVDNDAARLSAGILATCYHKVLIDVGTAIVPSSEPGRSIEQADVRIVLPDEGCLLCTGGLADHARAVEDLGRPRTSEPPQDQFGEQRLGSLRSLNELATAVGVRMLEQLVTARLGRSRWAHLEFGAAGELSVRYPEVGPAPGCPLCRKSGLGDASGLGR